MRRKSNYINLLIVLAVLLGIAGGLYYNEYTEKESNNISALLDLGENNDYINNKVTYFQENYGVNVNVYTNPNYLNSNYQMGAVYSEKNIMYALSDLEEYFISFNKDFFSRFYEYGMNGLNIYFADGITGLTNGFDKTKVVGLYFKKDKKYNIIIDINASSSVKDIISHETMHLIEDYLNIKEYNFSNWNKLNPSGFSYKNTYYIKTRYDDTLKDNSNSKNVYFIDNYARSNASEDRARVFEAIIKGEEYRNYPYLNAKVRFLKGLILDNFPELNSYF